MSVSESTDGRETLKIVRGIRSLTLAAPCGQAAGDVAMSVSESTAGRETLKIVREIRSLTLAATGTVRASRW